MVSKFFLKSVKGMTSHATQGSRKEARRKREPGGGGEFGEAHLHSARTSVTSPLAVPAPAISTTHSRPRRRRRRRRRRAYASLSARSLLSAVQNRRKFRCVSEVAKSSRIFSNKLCL